MIIQKKDLNLDLKLVEETYKDKNNIKLLISILNIWKNKEELTEDINKAFSSKYSEGKVMLFDSNEKINLFENCIYYENFEWLNRILLFSFLLKKSKNKDAADKFVKFLQSEKALKVFRSYGFTINK